MTKKKRKEKEIIMEVKKNFVNCMERTYYTKISMAMDEHGKYFRFTQLYHSLFSVIFELFERL